MARYRLKIGHGRVHQDGLCMFNVDQVIWPLIYQVWISWKINKGAKKKEQACLNAIANT